MFLKKLFLGFFIALLSTGSVVSLTFAEEGGYSLRDALNQSSGMTEEALNESLIYLPGADDTSTENKGGVAHLSYTIQKFINGFTALAGAIAVLFIVINGGKMVISAGDSDQLTSAKKGLTWAIAGLLLIIFSYVIAKTVITLTYSGEEYSSEETVDPTPESTAPASIACTAPDSCYDSRNRTIPGCADRVASEACSDLNLSCSGSTSNKIKAIQTKVFSGFNGCAKTDIDGKYGSCTQQALQKYYDDHINDGCVK